MREEAALDVTLPPDAPPLVRRAAPLLGAGLV